MVMSKEIAKVPEGKIRGIICECGCGVLKMINIEDADAHLIDGFLVIPDRYMCDGCIPSFRDREKRASA